MASDGGPAFPFAFRCESSDGTYENYDGPGGMSVRDHFAAAIVAGEGRPGRSVQVAEAQEVYRYAQLLTDEKLRRDKADRDEGKQPE